MFNLVCGTGPQVGETIAAHPLVDMVSLTGSVRAGRRLCDAALASLEAEGHAVKVFDAVEADPSRATLMKAVEAGRAVEATGVAGFGNGSSFDVAKLAALLLGSNEDLDGAWGVAQASSPLLSNISASIAE